MSRPSRPQVGSLILVVGLVGLARPAAADSRLKSPSIVEAGKKSPIIDPQKATVVVRVNNEVRIEALLGSR
jgi:hypothetical protein